ncbi:hypothetical protein ABZS88_00230 [Streptomyces sp. NPDC005480]|uniref:hypothetical protein n=1 Tax=Streptomyces sp. NPDC005480 TaxID=3154880 RepID=UPI0033A24C7D
MTHGTHDAFTQEVVGALMFGGDPMAVMKCALREHRIGIEFQFNQNAASPKQACS